jgi:integrase
MATINIKTQRTRSGPRYLVRYRLGGRSWPLVHGGSFKTMREARARRDLVAGEISAGRDPALLLHQPEAPKVRTFAEWGDAFITSRVDLTASSRRTIGSHLKSLNSEFGERDPAAITPSDVREWIGRLSLKPSSVQMYISTLRQVFDFIGTSPNPARDPSVRLPKRTPTVIEPPSAADTDAIIEHSPKQWRLPLRTLEQTGMRVGELCSLEWRDADVAGCRFRIRSGKTAAARRWVAVPDWLMAEIADTVPFDDRVPERKVFVGFTPDVAKAVMTRACRAAGIAHFTPHDLRHRYASVKIGEGVPVTQVSAQLGHTKKSMTLDTYSHVLLDD